MPGPPFVVRAAEVPEVEGAYPSPFDVERLSLGRDLGRAAGSRALGCWQERIPKGRRTSFTHAHLREEELVYVLSGTPTLRWRTIDAPPEEVVLGPGDFVAFPAGTGVAHTFRNDAEEDAVVLCVGERKAGEATTYPDDPLYEAWRDDQRPVRRWPGHRPTVTAAWPAWRVETERLVLRPWDPSDAPALLELQTVNQRHLAVHMPWARSLPTLDELLESVSSFMASFLRGGDLVYGIFLPDGKPIGGCGLHPRVGPEGLEIGYWIAADREGRGYVTEAAGALARLAFEAQRKQVVEIHCDPRNPRSAAVAARLGFTHVATLPGRMVDLLGRPRDTMVWSLTAEAYPESPARRVHLVARDALGRRLL